MSAQQNTGCWGIEKCLQGVSHPEIATQFSLPNTALHLLRKALFGDVKKVMNIPLIIISLYSNQISANHKNGGQISVRTANLNIPQRHTIIKHAVVIGSSVKCPWGF